MTALRDLVGGRVALVWVALVAATLLSWQLGGGHGFAGGDPRSATVAVLVVAFVKVRLVGLHFMELRDAPRALRALFEGYVAVVGTALVVMYLAL